MQILKLPYNVSPVINIDIFVADTLPQQINPKTMWVCVFRRVCLQSKWDSNRV